MVSRNVALDALRDFLELSAAPVGHEHHAPIFEAEDLGFELVPAPLHKLSEEVNSKVSRDAALAPTRYCVEGGRSAYLDI